MIVMKPLYEIYADKGMQDPPPVMRAGELVGEE